MDLARHAQALLEAMPEIEVVTPAVLSVVTFRYLPPAMRDAGTVDEATVERINQAIVRGVWSSGRAMITSTRVRGRYVLRMCVVNHNTRRADVEEVVRLIAELGAEIAGETR
jgi:glutamate/tyrosine decarboxylase-like PLP-dependent enzyme